MAKKKTKIRDPLYQLFEYYLFNRSYEDTSAFTKEVAEEYLTYLDSSPAHVPFHSRMALLKDLESEAHEMLVKKMYGCGQDSKDKLYGLVISVDDNRQELTAHTYSPPPQTEDKER